MKTLCATAKLVPKLDLRAVKCNHCATSSGGMVQSLSSSLSMPFPDPPPLSSADRFAALRIIDANFNRATEALRVLEEYCRFGLNDGHLTKCWKELRHSLAKIQSS